MAANELPSQDFLRQLLDYDPATGALTWKARSLSLFNETAARTAKHACAHWNSRFAGKPALTAAMKHGHQYGKALGMKMAAHRVAWKWVHGYDPDVIDHINGNPSDNRIQNLRSVTQRVNGRNRKLSKRNTSGFTGVFWDKPLSKWIAYIYVLGDRKVLGYFHEKDDAIAARRAADEAEGFISRA